MEFFNVSSPHFYIQLIVALLNGFVLCLCGYKFLQIIQLTGYKLKGFFSWIRDTKGKYALRLFFLSLMSFVCMITINVLFNAFGANSYFAYIALIIYFYFSIFFGLRINDFKSKTPIKYTHRMDRLIGVLMVLGTIVSFVLLRTANSLGSVISFSLIALTPLALLVLVPICYFIVLPFELCNNARFIAKAKRKLKKFELSDNKLIKIGITGSFGKTTAKNILNTILSEKYKVCISPLSYNTPMGITKTILKNLTEQDQILICEMGARRKDDIKKLCDIVNPKIGILTSIGECHLETFKTVANVMSTKFELIESVSASKGYAIFGNGNEQILSLYKKTTCEKINVGFDEKNGIYAKNIKPTIDGTTFEIVYNNKSFLAKTKLLGVHNIENILFSVACAFKLELSVEQVQTGIEKILPIPHRLELIKGENGVTILDDAYNSNIIGCKRALEVLGYFSGNKVVVTPGIVELGNRQYESNVEFGKDIAALANYAIIVNLENQKALLEGLLAGDMAEDKIYKVTSLKEAKTVMAMILKEGDTVLIENDLPDNYS